ncbi:hypothetical protein FC652_05855 [Vibrio sp. 05-20-BW147]|nr:hypothetical protein [Vibrio sp. 05-20-BW147]
MELNICRMIAHITMRNRTIKQADIYDTFRAAQRLLGLFTGQIDPRSIDSLPPAGERCRGSLFSSTLALRPFSKRSERMFDL